ncbi:hypothetical protein [Acidovorax sp. NCPPB 4044]|uniref:hypothetical protein n=1 Tax=Acidovorax sp. NCPPB 4044 TaxID=2940490 RepID=UPI0023038922|nr:hypothetical protein [Acidovorax sp. NCPPB 4044]MDA8521967.1 hypothetical protein [Acidovorax sp. NCPPB 4044]
MNTHLTRDQAIAAVGAAAVDAVEYVNCDFTNRVTGDGTVEFSASVGAKDEDGEDVTLVAYYFQDAEALDGVEDLSDLDWAIDHYTVR